MRNANCEALGMIRLDSPAARLKWARETRSKYKTATEAARAFGWTVPTYLGHENGDRNPSRSAAMRYAEAYRVRWAWLLEGGPNPEKGAVIDDEEEPVVPIAHYVGAGDEVHLFDGDHNAVDHTPAPPGFQRDKGAAVQVRGESMRPLYEPGDLLFFRRRLHPPATPKDVPVRPVIVQVKDGPLFVKRLLPGTKRGRFHLISVNPLTPIMQDQPVESFALIEWVKPKV